MKSAVIAFLTCLLVFCVQGQEVISLNCKCSTYIRGKISKEHIKAGPVVHDPSVFCPRIEIIITTTGNKEKCVHPQSKVGQLILKNRHNRNRTVSNTMASNSTTVHMTMASNSTSVQTTASSLTSVPGQQSHSLKCKCSNSYISGRISKEHIKAGPVVHDPSVFCPRTEIIITIIGNKEKCVNPQSKLGELILTNRNKNKQETSRAVTTTEASSSTSVPTTVDSSSASVHTTVDSRSTSVHMTPRL